jgi:hypothetical protein
VFIAERGSGTAEGWKLDPGTACTGNTFVAPLVTNCGGYGFLINDATCTNNVVSDGHLANNTEGGLFEVGQKPVPPLAAVMP